MTMAQRTFKHMIHSTKFIIVLFLLQIQSGCVTKQPPVDRRPEGVVVERNKEVRPAWVDSPTKSLLVSATETRFHYPLLKQRDLPIAVKQSQTKAVEESFILWRPSFDQRLNDVPQINGLRTSSRTSKETEKILDQVASKIHTEIAQIEDIYFERIRIDNFNLVPELTGVTEYFDVHTLVQLMPIDTERLKNVLGNSLQASKYSEMKKVGKELAPPKKTKK